MTEKKFTPGPWVTTLDEDGYWVVAEENGYWIACTERGSVGFEAQEANANLIAAAPDLYTALDDLTDAMSLWESEGNLPPEWEPVLADAVRALRKALGEDAPHA